MYYQSDASQYQREFSWREYVSSAEGLVGDADQASFFEKKVMQLLWYTRRKNWQIFGTCSVDTKKSWTTNMGSSSLPNGADCVQSNENASWFEQEIIVMQLKDDTHVANSSRKGFIQHVLE